MKLPYILILLFINLILNYLIQKIGIGTKKRRLMVIGLTFLWISEFFVVAQIILLGCSCKYKQQLDSLESRHAMLNMRVIEVQSEVEILRNRFEEYKKERKFIGPKKP